MEKEVRMPLWRDWTLFSLKWLLLVLFAAGIYLTRQQAGSPDPGAGLAAAFAIGAFANVVYLLFLLLSLPAAIPIVLVLTDIVTAGVFVHASQGNHLLIVGVVSSLMLTSVLRLAPTATFTHVTGMIVMMVSVLAYMRDDRVFARAIGDFTVPFLFLVALAVVTFVASYVLDRTLGAQQRRIAELEGGETGALHAMRERSKAIYELSVTISATLNYDKILTAALEAGRLSLKDSSGSGYVSAVLLFRAENSVLHVVASRRFTRADETVVIRGLEGIVGQALREATPVFANDISRDPELNYFSAFQYCRSVLCVPLRAGFDNFGVLLYGSEKREAFDDEQSELLTAIGSHATIALQNAVLYRSLLEEKERVVEVEEDARKKLARDLHDGPTQSVAAIAMRMSVISRLIEKKPEQVPDELRKVEDLARKTAKEIRHMLFTLRPLVLETQGLGPALSQLAEKMQETHGQAVAVRMGRDVEAALSAHHQGILFYIIEEAVNNARKHAKADLISVTVGRQEDMMICQIADNGVGFDTNKVTRNYDQRGSLGMVNMRERTELLDGSMRMDSVEGKGTCITLFVPLNGARIHGGMGSDGRERPLTKLALAAVERNTGMLRS